MHNGPKKLPHSKPRRSYGPRASQTVGSPLLSWDVVSHKRGSAPASPGPSNPGLSTDFGSLPLKPRSPLKRGMGKIFPTCKGFGATDPSEEIHGHTPLKGTKRPRGLGMSLGQNGAAGCLPGLPMQHFPAKCLSFPTCNKGVRPALGPGSGCSGRTQQFAQDKWAVWRPHVVAKGD